MITDVDIQKLAKIFATKEDLQSMESGIRRDMATKDDLKRFATKEDLKRFATKEDLKSFATKEDLKRFATKEDLKRFATKEDVQEIVNESTLGIVEGVKTIIDMLGETAYKADKNDEELRTVRMVQGDHEKRIRTLEHASA